MLWMGKRITKSAYNVFAKGLYSNSIISIIIVQWGKIKMECKCFQCQYEWESRKEIPKQCPRCKRYDWDVLKKEVKQNDGNN